MIIYKDIIIFKIISSFYYLSNIAINKIKEIFIETNIRSILNLLNLLNNIRYI